MGIGADRQAARTHHRTGRPRDAGKRIRRTLRRVVTPLGSLPELFAALEAARDADDEGGLSILDHGLQCADLLASLRPDDFELQVAGLVHDLGWLEREGGGWRLREDAAHDVVGRDLAGGLLGPRVARLVGGHVAAKRYLLATDRSYAARLSARSEVTLTFQGGVMGARECAAFEHDPDHTDLVMLRRADDDAKVRGKRVPGIDRWRPLVELVASGG
jgi:predicted HD phosphohydrolase